MPIELGPSSFGGTVLASMSVHLSAAHGVRWDLECVIFSCLVTLIITPKLLHRRIDACVSYLLLHEAYQGCQTYPKCPRASKELPGFHSFRCWIWCCGDRSRRGFADLEVEEAIEAWISRSGTRFQYPEMAKVELAMDSRCCTGESPVSYASGNLRFVDIEGCRIHSFDTVANRPAGELATNGRMVGNVVPCASPALPIFDLLASLETSVVPVNFDAHDCNSDPVAAVPDAHLDVAKPIRFNDGKVDLQGRLWAGTMALDPTANPNAGRFYCLRRGASLEGAATRASYDLVEKISPVGISNGMDWYGQHMYYIDSLQPEVSVFDFDALEGSISNRRRVFEIPETRGLPDGMTLDANGKVWVAVYGGSSIVQIDPETQTELMNVEVPVLCPTSVVFGGKDLSELYVTSGGWGEEKKGGSSPNRGSLFRVLIPGVKGLSFSQAFTQ